MTIAIDGSERPVPVRPADAPTTAPIAFVPEAISTFRIESYEFDAATGHVALHYSLDAIDFTETVTLPGAPFDLTADRRRAMDRVLWLLHLAAGTSYFKAAAPAHIEVAGGPLPPAAGAFCTDLYREGLAEFAWSNGLDLSGLVFPTEEREPSPPAPSLGLDPTSLVTVGGGKDSVVSIEAVTRAELPAVLFSVRTARAIEATVQVAGLPHLVAGRTIAPNLLELNKRGALNGHVPVTAINSLVACATAIANGWGYVVMSNERSASVGTDVGAGHLVNHQYSKSFSFEIALRRVLHRYVAPDLEYFSLLRPLSELTIARAFAHLPKYWHAITSCNRAFRLDPARRTSSWCGDCAKCRFVFLVLAPNFDPPDLEEIIGHDLLDDPAQVDGLVALLGLGTPKPFECVGDEAENRASLARLLRAPAWQSHRAVVALAALAADAGIALEVDDQLFAVSAAHCIPASHGRALDEIVRM